MFVVVLRSELASLFDEHLAELGRLLALAQIGTHVVVHLVGRVHFQEEANKSRHCKHQRHVIRILLCLYDLFLEGRLLIERIWMVIA